MREVSEGRIPRAIARIDNLVDALESYVRLAPPETVLAQETPQIATPVVDTTISPHDNTLESGTDSADQTNHKDHSNYSANTIHFYPLLKMI